MMLVRDCLIIYFLIDLHIDFLMSLNNRMLNIIHDGLESIVVVAYVRSLTLCVPINNEISNMNTSSIVGSFELFIH
jgi:hypothetical protein